MTLIVGEVHSRAVSDFSDDHQARSWVSPGLLRVWVMRAVTRSRPAGAVRARQQLLASDDLALDDDVLQAAAGERGRMLRSLDALNVASARVLLSALQTLVTYDTRLAAAARAAGTVVLAPGTAPQVQP